MSETNDHGGRKTGGRRVGWAVLGAILIAVAITTLVLNFQLPWLSLADGNQAVFPEGEDMPAGQTLDRSGLKAMNDAGIPYTDSLMEWPVTALLVLGVAGAALLLLGLVPEVDRHVRRLGGSAIFLVAAGAAYVLALTGFRWLGNLIEHLLSPGEAMIQLLVVPYMNLGVGLTVFVLATWFLIREIRAIRAEHAAGPSGGRLRTAQVMLLVALVALVVLPLLPYTAHDTPFGTYYLGEATYSSFAHFDSDEGGQAGSMIVLARTALWATLMISLAGLMVLLVRPFFKDERSMLALLEQLPVLNLVPVVVGLIATGLSYPPMFSMVDTTISVNHVLPVAFIVLAILVGLWVKRYTLPFLRGSTKKMDFAQEKGTPQNP